MSHKLIGISWLKSFPIVHSDIDDTFKVTDVFDNTVKVDIMAATDFTMMPGEARYIDTGLKIMATDHACIITVTPSENMIFKTSLDIRSAPVIRKINDLIEETATFKFMIHNFKTPITYPVKIPGDRPSFMMDNKITLINGDEISSTPGLVPMNSYLIRKNDIIAQILITKI